MAEQENSRNYQTLSTLNPGTRLEALHSPVAGKIRPVPYKQLTHQQRAALVEKLIDFLKSM